MSLSRPRYLPIEDYGIIGDLHTVALVSTDASIDFLCMPSFDSPSVFAALLDRHRGGFFQVAPTLEDLRSTQLYLPDSNVLLSRFLSRAGVAEISDFMPVKEIGQPHVHNIVRRAKTVRGEVHYSMVCSPSFDYGRASHQVELRGGEVYFSSGNRVLRLEANVPMEIHDGAARADFILGEGQTALFVLDNICNGRPSPPLNSGYVTESFKDTINFWRNWVARSSYRGRWREMVNRSALTLKLLTSHQHGSIVAAPTFGLPETVGGERNWDYRYTWIRDASFTLYALIRLGYTDEAAAFMRWITERCHELNSDGSLQLMYRLNGSTNLTEVNLTHLEGYRGSSPVRVGNGAAGQLQLDIYGELMDSVYLSNQYGEPIHHDLWANLVGLIDWVCLNWHREDEGIWEVRGGKKEFLYSRLMCWVALDRGIRLSLKRSFPAPLDRWSAVRDTIYRDIFDNFWNREKEAFVQHRGSTSLDASTLLLPLVKFVSPTDPRWLSTLAAIERELVDDSLVFRYRGAEAASDGLVGEEGTFSMCSFWYVECLARSGDLRKARFLFEKMLGYANHLGLYSEQLGPRGEHLGNYPQAFTHVALISAAYKLDQMLHAAGKQALDDH